MAYDHVWAQSGSFGITLDRNDVIVDITASCVDTFEAPPDVVVGSSLDAWYIESPVPAIKSHTGKVTRVTASWAENSDGSRVGWFVNAETEYAAMQRSLGFADDLKQLEYAVSHDLMEPIRMVSGYLSMFMEEEKTGVGNRDYLVKAQDATLMTRNFLKDFVEYLRLDTNRRAHATLRPLNLNEVVHDVLRSLHFLIQEAGAEVIVSDMPIIPGDGRMFYQVFSNLISNSLKYRDPDRPCKVKVTSYTNDFVHIIQVTDNGRGIHPAKIERVFAPFMRGHKDVPGSGIGLAIVKRCLEYHDASIRAASILGEGTTFTIELPKVRAALSSPLPPG